MNSPLPPLAAVTSKMPIKAISPWFGSKRTMSPTIIKEIGEHKVYWEPFCGSMAVLLAKSECRTETVNDLHGDLINLARVLKDRNLAEQLYDRTSRLLMHEGLFYEAASATEARKDVPAPEIPSVDRAFDFWLMSWMGISGLLGTRCYTGRYAVRYSSKGGHAATRFRHASESIPAWHERLRRVTILSRDGIKLCEPDGIEDEQGVVIYVDPPYLKKGGEYVHDFDWLAHRRLAKALRRFTKSRVVVSYYDHFDLNELYPGWTKVQIDATKSITNQGKRDGNGATNAPEVLLINGPSFAEVQS